MKQLTQILKSGEMAVRDIPVPVLNKGTVLVKNHYSLISAGTESSTVKTARKSILGKIKERPQQVKQVLDTLQKAGPLQTFRAVMKKLDAYSPLGYSSSGEIIDVGEGVVGLKVGDKVACSGAGYANHAEVISVPVNLCVKLNGNADLKKAAYNTLGAIAMQGIRQANLKIGESCAVIGLGLLGQLTLLILRASGVRVIGIDISSYAVSKANEFVADAAFERQTPGITNRILELTDGYGVDAVIISAGTSNLDPINFAGEISRKKGKVIIVGAVPTGFDRENYYKKELELRMSCSYGPGRYDLNYEEKGIDYPYPYVRWTEKRNMQAFQELIYSGKISIDYLTTHEFKIEEAEKAYDMIIESSEPYLGIILKYDSEKAVDTNKIYISNGSIRKDSVVNIGFIGAGSYAFSHLLPNISTGKDISLKGVLTNNGTSSRRAAEKYNFEFCTSEIKDIMENKEINTVFIATRHDSHAKYVMEALKNNKHIFVEKPLCLTKTELKHIKECYNGSNQLMVGFNRRFAPLAVELKKYLSDAPISMIYRINAGFVPKDSWIQDLEVGGGRIIGEVCHFLDFFSWMCGSLPISIYANAVKDPANLNDTICINLCFSNGSIGTINYFANGSKKLNKEYCEVYQSGFTGIIKDFKELEIWGENRKKKKLLNQDKGQKVMVEKFIKLIPSGQQLIPAKEIFSITDATFKVLDSIDTGRSITLT